MLKSITCSALRWVRCQFAVELSALRQSGREQTWGYEEFRQEASPEIENERSCAFFPTENDAYCYRFVRLRKG